MNISKKNAIIVGVLFLIALIFNLIASSILDPIVSISDYIVNTYPNKNFVIIGNLLNLICAIAMIFIPIYLFPVIEKRYRNLAFAYVVFRSLEGLLFIYMAIKTLTLINLSNEYINGIVQNDNFLKTLGSSINSEIHWATIIYIIIFNFGAMIFYTLLYKTKLVPKFLAVWGFLAAIILLIGVTLGMFSFGIFSNITIMEGMVYFAPPIALNEFVLAIWLIIRGFNLSVQSSST